MPKEILKEANCALCGTYSTLQKSHMIPKFVAEWVKKTSETGYLRDAIRPNQRIQDFPKFRLLCAKCENIFSQWENQFAREIFIPFQDKKQKSFIYEEWLLSFIISLAWRGATIFAEDIEQDDPPFSFICKYCS